MTAKENVAEERREKKSESKEDKVKRICEAEDKGEFS